MMPSDMKPRADYLIPTVDMELSLQSQNGSKQQQKSQTMKGRRLPQENQLKYQLKLKGKKFADLGSRDLPDEPRQDADEGIFVRPKSSRDWQQHCVKAKPTKDDELVKYMSNLPGYLQGMEKEENFQEKVFNVGVLDWARLEKWKSVQKHTPGSDGKYAPSTSRNVSSKRTIKSSTFSSTPHSKTCAQQIEQHPSLGSGLNSSQIDGLSRGVKPSGQKNIPTQDLETASTSDFDRHRETPRSCKSLGRISDEIHENEKRKCLDQKITSRTGDFSSHLRNGTPSSSENVRTLDGKARKVAVKMQESGTTKKALDQKNMLDVCASSPKLGSGRMSLSSNGKLRVRYDESRNRGEMPESDTNLHHQRCPGESKNIVVLLPRKLSRNSSSQEPQTLFHKKMIEGNQNSFTDCSSSEDVHSGEFHSAIPHSCPLPSKVGINIHPGMTTDSLGIQFSSDTSHVSLHSRKMPELLCDGKPAKQDNTDSKNVNVDETLKSLDQELIEVAARKGRSSSPNRRFSFSLGRMGRSFSFKEGSDSSQLSSRYVSVKSGPVTTQASTCLGEKNTEKANGHNRTRSSPLRRILDPLLRSKVSNLSRSAETVQSFKGNLKSSFSPRPNNASESLQMEKHKSLTGFTGVGAVSHATHSIGKASSTIQAVLQLTVKNGLPLFKFVVENSSCILAATMKNMTSPGKDDLGQHYTFYSVNEIKKKSGSWISQGSKVKQSGYVYNVVGQMKASSPNFLNLTIQSSADLCMVRESALFGIDVRQAEQASSKFIPNRELAAIVVKMPTENASYDAKQSDEDYGLKQKNYTECTPEDGWSSNLGENKDSGVTVILPGGDHGLPIKGAPSPLIDRWKSGGSCDCGGWDVGCRLRVLSNQNQYSKNPRTTKACTDLDCFELFIQGETQHSRPVFSLAPLTKGIYSVEFNSSVSLLQAFFICVAVMSSRKLSNLSDGSHLSEGKAFQEPNLNENLAMKEASTPVLNEFPVKYAPNPPLSPVGRV